MEPPYSEHGPESDIDFNLTSCYEHQPERYALCHLTCDAGSWDYTPHSVPNCADPEHAFYTAPPDPGEYNLHGHFIWPDGTECCSHAIVKVTPEQ